MAKVLDPVRDAVPMVQSFDVTIYIYVDTVLGRQLQNWVSKNMSREAKKTVRDFGIRQGEPIAAVVTLRKQKAIDFLKKVLPVIDNKISRSSFDKQGNFAFGLKEHIEIAGVKYDPDVGIFGMDVCVTMSRPGYRVKTRRHQKTNVGPKHMLTPEESIVFVKQTLGVEVI